jgi:hypothetical protein
MTWRFLRDATRENVDAVVNSILASDDKLVNGLTLRRLFSPDPEHNREGYTARKVAPAGRPPSTTSSPAPSHRPT